jgi:GTP-binding protein
MTRTRKAIVGDQPGITRDRIFQVAQWDDRYFEVVDTGGIIPEDKEDIPEAIFRQAEIAVEEASLILLVVDGREGIMLTKSTIQ